MDQRHENISQKLLAGDEIGRVGSMETVARSTVNGYQRMGRSSYFRSIVIPAYNEEARINGILLALTDKFPCQDIVVVCDGQDDTVGVVNDLSIKFPNIRVLSFNDRLGKGGALIEGFKAAKGEEICFVDADESIGVDDLENMFLALRDADGVIASRRLKESKILIEQPFKRRLASKAFNIFVKALFGLPFKDTQCGAKIFKRNAIYAILDELITSGFEIDVEILWRLRNKGYAIIEYPITWKHSEGSKFRLSHSWGMLISLIKIRLIG
ncbi:MAG: glycosyltransferase [Methanotrichaceae archaeon]